MLNRLFVTLFFWFFNYTLPCFAAHVVGNGGDPIYDVFALGTKRAEQMLIAIEQFQYDSMAESKINDLSWIRNNISVAVKKNKEIVFRWVPDHDEKYCAWNVVGTPEVLLSFEKCSKTISSVSEVLALAIHETLHDVDETLSENRVITLSQEILKFGYQTFPFFPMIEKNVRLDRSRGIAPFLLSPSQDIGDISPIYVENGQLQTHSIVNGDEVLNRRISVPGNEKRGFHGAVVANFADPENPTRRYALIWGGCDGHWLKNVFVCHKSFKTGYLIESEGGRQTIIHFLPDTGIEGRVNPFVWRGEKEELYFSGGYSVNKDGTLKAETGDFKFDVNSRKWLPLQNKFSAKNPTARFSPQYVETIDYIFMFGGCKKFYDRGVIGSKCYDPQKDMWKFNKKTQVWAPVGLPDLSDDDFTDATLAPGPIDAQKSYEHSTSAFIWGGRFCNLWRFENDSSWSLASAENETPECRLRPMSHTSGFNITFFGGTTPEGTLARSVLIYSLRKNKWDEQTHPALKPIFGGWPLSYETFAFSKSDQPGIFTSIRHIDLDTLMGRNSH